MYPVYYDPYWSGAWMWQFWMMVLAGIALLALAMNLDTIVEWMGGVGERRRKRAETDEIKARTEYTRALTSLIAQGAWERQNDRMIAVLALQMLQAGQPLSGPIPEPMMRQLAAPTTTDWSPYPQAQPWQVVEPVRPARQAKSQTFNEALDRLLTSGDKALQRWGGR